jgi:oligosaccharide repeat unit polymerase
VTALFIAYFVINMAMVTFLLRQCWSIRFFDCLAGSAINPLLIFCFVSLLFNLDFVTLWNLPEIEFLELVTSLPQGTILDAYGTYTFLFLGVFGGFGVAFVYWARDTRSMRKPRSAPAYDRSAKLAAQILFYVALVFATVVLLIVYTPSVYTEVSYTVVGRENPILTIAWWVIPSGAALLVAYHPKPLSGTRLLGLIVSAVVIGVSGGARLPALLILLIIGIAYTTFNRKRISINWYVPTILGTAVFLAMTRYVFREGEKYATFDEFISGEGGYLRLFFSGEEVSFAKVFSVVYAYSPLQREPFESFLALVLLPFPRQMATFKPFGGSSAFTQHVSPFRWEWTKSETLITGYGDFLWQFGLYGAAVGVFVLGFLWLWLCLRVVRSPAQTTVLWTPLLIWWMYMFVRGDIFNIGLLLWPALVMIALHRLLSRLLARVYEHREVTGRVQHEL